ncbi:phytoene/squalene synthase family protein [Roseospira marina]|uniref:Phytoene/squalene synthase family protein n=1 Tax=Roseospira marina TaxID=140057 RepID=A0A5M6IF18_9PROT|nr:phytoene/squalene synthase family protein [Roseospira marina]KAA5606874.1 phytoene/squalene synthase family protein [Roseospira marina]MBB4312958.1 phytoene synthase [Roseospira marina]MBB5086269.1 phytoene synthase [Roseospira marina]
MPQPWSKTQEIASPDDRAQCRAMIRTGSRSFYTASLLLPQAYRDPAYALYAFCRFSDDVVDECENAAAPDACIEAVAHLRYRLDRVYAGQPMNSPVDRSFRDMVVQTGMPRELPEALLEGFEWDAEARRYETISEVRAYSARVAAAVGAMMTVLMGVRHPHVLARACDLGVAMQLSNIARDVGEDARNGRLYLPRQWMVDAGLDPDAWLANPVWSPALASVVARLLDEARRLYDRAAGGIAGLPLGCRAAIHAARLIYAGIGDEVAKANFDSVSQRAYVPGKRKLALLGQATRDAVLYRRIDPAPALPETHFLVEAAAVERNIWVDSRRPVAVGAEADEADERGSFGGRLVWAMQLCSQLEERRRA